MNDNYITSRETVQHVDAVLKIMIVLTNDTRFEEIQKIIRNMLKLNKSIDEIAMCCGVRADDVKAIQKSIWEEEF